MSTFLKSIKVEARGKPKSRELSAFLLAGPNLPGKKEEGICLHTELPITFGGTILDSVINLGKMFSRCFQVVTV